MAPLGKRVRASKAGGMGPGFPSIIGPASLSWVSTRMPNAPFRRTEARRCVEMGLAGNEVLGLLDVGDDRLGGLDAAAG